VRPAPRLEAISPDIFEKITHAMARNDTLPSRGEWQNTLHVQSLLVERVEPWPSAARCYD
jgi:hypothetical protein